MHLVVTSKNESWPQLIWPTLQLELFSREYRGDLLDNFRRNALSSVLRRHIQVLQVHCTTFPRRVDLIEHAVRHQLPTSTDTDVTCHMVFVFVYCKTHLYFCVPSIYRILQSHQRHKNKGSQIFEISCYCSVILNPASKDAKLMAAKIKSFTVTHYFRLSWSSQEENVGISFLPKYLGVGGVCVLESCTFLEAGGQSWSRGIAPVGDQWS